MLDLKPGDRLLWNAEPEFNYLGVLVFNRYLDENKKRAEVFSEGTNEITTVHLSDCRKVTPLDNVIN